MTDTKDIKIDPELVRDLLHKIGETKLKIEMLQLCVRAIFNSKELIGVAKTLGMNAINKELEKHKDYLRGLKEL